MFLNRFTAGLMDEISYKVRGVYTISGIQFLLLIHKIYDALAYHVSQVNMNKRIKTVSLWSLQMTASAVLSALRNAIDPLSQHLREMYLDGQRFYETGAFEEEV
jgi:hypothetical protein